MSIRLLGDRLLVSPISKESVTGSGIIIPDTAKEKPNTARVNFVAADSVFKEGDIVVYSKHAGLPLEVDDVEYLLLREGDVFMIK